MRAGTAPGTGHGPRRYGAAEADRQEAALRLHVIDGTYELFRAHFSKRPGRSTPDGMPIKATVGLVASLLSLLHDPEHGVTHVAVAFDNPIRSFRNDLFAGYKTGDEVDQELTAQFDLAEQAVAAIGVTVWSMRRYEADDAMATAAARWSGETDQVLLVTPDKDLGQCVDDDRNVVLLDRRHGAVVDAAGVQERLGVLPHSVPDLLALVGDSADGIPGLPGFGKVTAGALLRRYRHLEAIPDDPGAWDVSVRGAARLGATLRDRWEDVLLYRHLATLVDDVPLEEDLADLAWPGVPRTRFVEWCAQTGADRLRDRPERWAG